METHPRTCQKSAYCGRKGCVWLVLTDVLLRYSYRQSRRALDEYAARSFQRAEKAQKEGNFDQEIVPVFIEKDGKTIEVKRDDGIRAGTTAEVS